MDDATIAKSLLLILLVVGRVGPLLAPRALRLADISQSN
jgi:hypothetical protein